MVLQSHKLADHSLPSRAPKKRFASSFANKIDEDFEDESCKPISNGFLYCPPNSGEAQSRPLSDVSSISTDDEGYETPSTRRAQRPQQTQNKKIPTLKRKLSEWEKNEKRRSKF